MMRFCCTVFLKKQGEILEALRFEAAILLALQYTHFFSGEARLLHLLDWRYGIAVLIEDGQG